MRVRFTLPIKTFSINSMYYGDGRTKTQKAHNWSETVLHYIRDGAIQVELEKLRSVFDPKKHGYYVKLRAFYPKKIIFRQDGAFSSKAHDVSNWEKPLIDLLFLPKHQGSLGVDDKYLCAVSSSKNCASDDKFSVDITIGLRAI